MQCVPTRYADWLKLLFCALLLVAGQAMPAAAQLSTAPPNCSAVPTYVATLGTANVVTDIPGDQTYAAGNYHVVGTLRFSGGQVTVMPGANFYVDGKIVIFKGTPRVAGYGIIIGQSCRFVANNALFTAACNGAKDGPSMWQGIQFESDKTEQYLSMDNGCGVAYALYGVQVPGVQPGAVNETRYDIRNSYFEQNLYHIYDQGRHNGILPCHLENLTLYSQPNLMPPYQANPNETWTLEALHLTPTGTRDGMPKIKVQGTITIQGAIYGIISNMPGEAELYFDSCVLDIGRTIRAGMWLDDTAPILVYPAQINIRLGYNTVASRTYRTYATQATDPMYGLIAATVNTQTTPNAITVSGVGGIDTTTSKMQTGVLFDQTVKGVQNLALSSLTYGLSLREGNAPVKGNTFAGCWHGLRMRDNAGYTVNMNVGCNTFVASGAISPSGILVDPGAYLNQQGGTGSPQGNKFSGYANGQYSVVNRNINSPFTYYRYTSSADEQVSAITDGFSLATGTVASTSSPYPLSGPNNFCQQTRGVSNAGAAARGTSQTTYMQALMDTLRQQMAPATRLGAYQAAIREWLLAEQPDTAALDAYVRTLPVTNPQAFLGLGLDLLEQYRRRGNRAAAARLHPLLALRAATYPEAAARLALSDVLSRLGNVAPWPALTRRVSVADSALLRRVARTPSGAAETAALWFNYLFPGAGLRPAARPASPAAAVRAQPVSRTAVPAFYPNPATDRLQLEAAVPTANQQVMLRLTDLVSGRVVVETSLPTGKNGRLQAQVDVRCLPSGQYAATLLVDGTPTAPQKVLINR